VAPLLVPNTAAGASLRAERCPAAFVVAHRAWFHPRQGVLHLGAWIVESLPGPLDRHAAHDAVLRTAGGVQLSSRRRATCKNRRSHREERHDRTLLRMTFLARSSWGTLVITADARMPVRRRSVTSGSTAPLLAAWPGLTASLGRPGRRRRVALCLSARRHRVLLPVRSGSRCVTESGLRSRRCLVASLGASRPAVFAHRKVGDVQQAAPLRSQQGTPMIASRGRRGARRPAPAASLRVRERPQAVGAAGR
jgi:hypothetical protein